MKTIEISNAIAEEVECAKQEGIASILLSLAQEFIDVTDLGTARDQKVFTHALTGKKLTIRASWDEE